MGKKLAEEAVETALDAQTGTRPRRSEKAPTDPLAVCGWPSPFPARTGLGGEERRERLYRDRGRIQDHQAPKARDVYPRTKPADVGRRECRPARSPRRPAALRSPRTGKHGSEGRDVRTRPAEPARARGCSGARRAFPSPREAFRVLWGRASRALLPAGRRGRSRGCTASWWEEKRWVYEAQVPARAQLLHDC